MTKSVIRRGILVAIMVAGIFPGWGTKAQSSPRRIVVTAKRFQFAPAEITLKKGQPIVLELKSTDAAHGLRFRELDLNVKVGAGGTTEVQFTPDKAGDFVGHCSVFCGSGHGTMALTLHVVD